MVSAEAMATVRRVTVMDRDAETDRDITEATVRRATVTDRDAETDQHTTEATVRRVTVMDRDVETDRDTTVTDRDVVEIVRDITEATVRRMAVPTEIRETAITDMTTTVVMTDRDANSEKNQITEEMTEEITQAFRLLQSKDRNHRERMLREKTITRRKIIVVMMKKECQRARRKTSQNSSFRNHSRKSRR